MFEMSVEKKPSLLCYENLDYSQYYRNNAEFDEKEDKIDLNSLDIYRSFPSFMLPPFNPSPPDISPELLSKAPFPLNFPSETSETELARCLGVRFDSSNSAWVARWVEPHSEKKKSRWFSVSKYGETAARRLAIQACLQNMRQSDSPGLLDLKNLVANFSFNAFPMHLNPANNISQPPPNQQQTPQQGQLQPPPSPNNYFNSSAALPNSSFILPQEPPMTTGPSTDESSAPIDASSGFNNTSDPSNIEKHAVPYNPLFPIANYMAALSMLPQVIIPPDEVIYQGVPQQQAASSTILEHPKSASDSIYTYNNEFTTFNPEIADELKVVDHTNSTTTNNGLENTSTDSSSNIYESDHNSAENNSDSEDINSFKKRKIVEPLPTNLENYVNYDAGLVPQYFPYQNSLIPTPPHPNFLPQFNSYQLDFASNNFFFSPFCQQNQLANLNFPGMSSNAPVSAKMTCERGLHYSKAYRGNQECWIAVWNTKGGRIMHEAFQVTVMGFEQAKIKAREARDSAHSNNISINENSRPSWKSHSNTGIPHVSLDSQQLRFRAHKYGRRLCRSFSFGKRRGSFATKETAFDAAVLWLIQTPTEEEIASTSGSISIKNSEPLN